MDPSQELETTTDEISSAADFKKHLKSITDSIDNCLQISDKLSTLKDGEVFKVGEVVIDRK